MSGRKGRGRKKKTSSEDVLADDSEVITEKEIDEPKEETEESKPKRKLRDRKEKDSKKVKTDDSTEEKSEKSDVAEETKRKAESSDPEEETTEERRVKKGKMAAEEESSPTGETFKIVSWNVNGLNACIKKGFKEFVQLEKMDVLCLQETKFDQTKIIKNFLTGFGFVSENWNCCTSQKGYAGTAVFSKVKPLSVNYGIGEAEGDAEGRTITLEFKDFYLVNTYVPNAGQGLARLTYRTETWDSNFLTYLNKLNAIKPIIWTGDLNVANENIDLANPDTNHKTAGFTDAERKGFKNLLSKGYVDSFRKMYPTKKEFTFWSYKHNARANNVGWRLDYYVVTEAFFPNIKEYFVRSKQEGSDHAPLGIIISRSLAVSDTLPAKITTSTTDVTSA